MDLTPFEQSTFPKNPDIVRFPKLVRFADDQRGKGRLAAQDGWYLDAHG